MGKVIDFKSKKILHESKTKIQAKAKKWFFSKKGKIVLSETHDDGTRTYECAARYESAGLWTAKKSGYSSTFVLLHGGKTNFSNCSWIPLTKNITEYYNSNDKD